MNILKNVSITSVKRFFEIHISNNDEKNDLHSRITKNCWQLKCLKKFINSGPKPNNTNFYL